MNKIRVFFVLVISVLLYSFDIDASQGITIIKHDKNGTLSYLNQQKKTFQIHGYDKLNSSVLENIFNTNGISQHIQTLIIQQSTIESLPALRKTYPSLRTLVLQNNTIKRLKIQPGDDFEQIIVQSNKITPEVSTYLSELKEKCVVIEGNNSTI